MFKDDRRKSRVVEGGGGKWKRWWKTVEVNLKEWALFEKKAV